MIPTAANFRGGVTFLQQHRTQGSAKVVMELVAISVAIMAVMTVTTIMMQMRGIFKVTRVVTSMGGKGRQLCSVLGRETRHWASRKPKKTAEAICWIA